MADNRFERNIEDANKWYLENNIAHIEKVNPPTVQRGKVRVLAGKSTVDYVGIYKGKFIAFDAKETVDKNFKTGHMIKPHQIIYIRSIVEHGGYGFIIVRMVSYNNRVWIIPINNSWMNQFWNTDRKHSMDEHDFCNFGIEVFEKIMMPPGIDYIAGLQKLILDTEKQKCVDD